MNASLSNKVLEVSCTLSSESLLAGERFWVSWSALLGKLRRPLSRCSTEAAEASFLLGVQRRLRRTEENPG